MSGWFFDPLLPFCADVVDVDPPTEFKLRSENGNKKSASAQYDIMSWDDLAKLPVGHLVRGNGIITLWACPPTLDQSMWLLKQWGARFKTELVWPKGRMGTGYRSRAMHESVLLGVFGDEHQIHDALYGVIKGKARGHSQKPREWYAHLRKKTPGLDRLCLFSRESHEGFTHWGNEVGTVEVGASVPPRRKKEKPTAAAPLFDEGAAA
ncbi:MULTISPECIES: MT-A70 family methyltransferase [Bradyrhizobium]|jgi:N6-adenosine-specific RNA methylase IME4|uniref:MT-A70 family methyltransferase n=1 Tax=Bradyrhizobium TaxID=374 RepID=UPI001BA48805|nr:MULTISPECIES: MT-A70 family methyltransferase [Bradyrhizobium]MBR1066894.1 DNA methyltransferase [Bradyrhizobium liaoningense]MDI2075520.1 MT-A70 family methyltransferase [Bradyrhizobium sp. Mp27]